MSPLKTVRVAYCHDSADCKEVLCTLALMMGKAWEITTYPDAIARHMTVGNLKTGKPLKAELEVNRRRVRPALDKLVEYGCLIIGKMDRGRLRIVLRKDVPKHPAIAAKREQMRRAA